jgi:hypothetical protein
MAEMVNSAIAEEAVSRIFSGITTGKDKNKSDERLEMAGLA